MSPEVTEQDLAEIHELVDANPGMELNRLKIQSRHAHARVREAVQELERRGEVLVVSDRVDQYIWPMAAADEATTMLAQDGYHRVSFDGD